MQVAEEEQEEAEAVEAAEVALRAEVVAEGVTGGDSEGAVEVVADFVVAVAALGGEAEAEADFKCHSLTVMIGNSWFDQIKPLVILCLPYTAPRFKLHAFHSTCSLMPCTSISTMLSNWQTVLPIGLMCVPVVVTVLLDQIDCGQNLPSHGVHILSTTPNCSHLVVLSFEF